MKIFKSLNEWRTFRHQLPSSQSIGFVPTMGNLHKGHLSLYTKSQQENDITVASIFINPTQFNQIDDFNHYPRTLEEDLNLLTLAKVDYCLLPENEAIYADGYHYQLQENNYSLQMEGQHRPGHFNGVLTIVMKLLHLVKPNKAYFGEKDYQQLQLIREMVAAFFIDTDIVSCPTIREISGLACSSRNARLTDQQRKIADQFAQIFHMTTLPTNKILIKLKELDIKVEYLEEHKRRRFVAVNIGNVRLIDNYSF